MTVDVATPHDSRMTRARRAFRRWRKSRPFWGGLLLILAGIEIFYSGNLNLGNIQIHLGLNGFKSYIIPLVVVLCGALTWATPAQRMFYGIIGTAATVYSIVSVNLGGFIIGLMLGIFGGALSIAWVPDKRVVAGSVDHGTPDDEDATTDFGAEFPAYVGEDPDQWRGPDGEESEEQEGEQREPFRQPRHAADDEPEPVVPTARTAPETDPAITGAGGHTADVAYPGDPNETTAPMPRLRGIPDVPHVRGSANVEGDDPSAGEQPSERGDGRGNPRAFTIAVIALTLGAFAALAIRFAAPAAAEACTPTPLQSAIQSAIAKAGVHEPAGTNPQPAGATRRTTGGTGTGTVTAAPKHNGDAALAPIASDQPQPVASLIGGVVGLLDLGSSASSTPSATPGAVPSGTPSLDPSPSPIATPTPTPAPAPTARPRPTVTKSASPGPSTSRSSGPTPATSSSAPPCSTTPKALPRADGQPIVGEKPATQKAALLTMAGLSYDGNVSLPTATGSIVAMQFSMSSTTSTPFELDVPVGDQQCTFTSSQLTLDGSVKIFATEIKGLSLGLVPVDFTPESPPPPIVDSDMFFTDATLTLAFVQSSTLTADKLTITSD
jgi:hypothetical protein